MSKKVYFSQDGGVDDIISLFLLLQMDDVDLIGVGVMGADSYLQPAAEASRKVIDRFGHGKNSRSPIRMLVQSILSRQNGASMPTLKTLCLS